MAYGFVKPAVGAELTKLFFLCLMLLALSCCHPDFWRSIRSSSRLLCHLKHAAGRMNISQTPAIVSVAGTRMFMPSLVNMKHEGRTSENGPSSATSRVHRASRSSELLSKLLVSPLITPIVVPYIIPYIIPLRSLEGRSSRKSALPPGRAPCSESRHRSLPSSMFLDPFRKTRCSLLVHMTLGPSQRPTRVGDCWVVWCLRGS